jgi:hypothetical protein
MIEEFKSEHKVGTLYRLNSTGSTRIEFGWVETDTLDLSVPVVVSYPSSSKKMDEEDLKKAKAAGRSAATFDDYHQYFFWLTGFEPTEYFELMRSKKYLKESTNFTAEQVDFIWSLGTFLINKKRFSIQGRSYKLVEYENEKRNQTTEVQP